MLSFVRHSLIRFLAPAAWRFSNDRKRRALQEYSLIEKDSGCQLLGAIGLIREPRARARFFQHVLEEFHHADLFEEAAHACTDAPLEVPVVARDEIVAPDAGPEALLDFVAYVHVGESSVNADFDIYADVAPGGRLRGVFKAVNADEKGHEASSMELLLAVAGGDAGRLRRALWRARVKRAWRSFLRLSRPVGESLLALILGGLYFLAGPLAARSSRRRFTLTRDDELRLLRRHAELWAA